MGAIKSTIGDRIRKARETKDIDQATLSGKVGIATRTLPVDLSLCGQPAIGYQAADAKIDPLEVIVSGPESLAATGR